MKTFNRGKVFFCVFFLLIFCPFALLPLPLTTIKERRAFVFSTFQLNKISVFADTVDPPDVTLAFLKTNRVHFWLQMLKLCLVICLFDDLAWY